MHWSCVLFAGKRGTRLGNAGPREPIRNGYKDVAFRLGFRPGFFAPGSHRLGAMRCEIPRPAGFAELSHSKSPMFCGLLPRSALKIQDIVD